MDLIKYNKLEIILFIILIATLFLIYSNYKKPLNSQSYLLGIYLYVSLSIILLSIFTTFISKYIKQKHLAISVKYYIISFIIMLLAISFISSNNLIVAHIALLIFILALSLLVSSMVSGSPDISKALMITATIIFALTLIAFSLPESGLNKLIGIMPILNIILFVLIIVMLIYILFFKSNPTLNKYFSAIIICLFVLFILADTSAIIKKSQYLPCKTQACINYPADSLGLSLDFVILFTNLLNFG